MANPTCGEIITEALEENGMRGLGDTPSHEEMARGLKRLQSMWNAGVESGLFGRVEEYYATADYEAEEGQRVYSGGYTITLPTAIEDEDSETNYRRPRDFAMVQVVNASDDPEVSLYDAHEAEWKRIDNLTEAGECPFGRRYRHGLVAALAVNLQPLGGQVGDITGSYVASLRSALSLRQSAPRRNADVEFM
jgi:hypothetical protein